MNIVITRFPYESQLGGMETMVLNLAKGLRAKGHHVSFVGTCSILLKMFEENNFKVTKLAIPRSPVSKGSLFLFILFYPFIWWQLKKIVKDLSDKDVLYMLSLAEKIVLTKKAYEKGIKVLWGEHEALQRGDGTFRHWMYSNPLLKRYRKNSGLATVVVVSQDLLRQFQELRGVHNVALIPNGIDLDFFSPTYKKKLTEMHGEFIVGTVGRLKKEKGIDVFLEMAARIAHRIPQTHFIIAGDGVLRPDLEQQAKQLGISHHVTFLGEVPHDRIREVYAMFDIAVFMSQEMETFGLTPLESMAMGKATIVTNAFGFLDESTKASMLIVEPGDINETVALVDRLYNDPAFRKGMEKEEMRFVIKYFSLQQMVDSYEQLFRLPAKIGS